MILKLIFLVVILALVAVIFGIYQPLLTWRSARNQLQLRAKAGLRLRKLLRQVNATLKPNFPVRFAHTASGVKVEPIGPATAARAPIFAAITGDTMHVFASAMPPRTRHTYRPLLFAWLLAALVVAVVMIVVVGPALAQDYVRVDGTVGPLSGNHVIVISDTAVWSIEETERGYLLEPHPVVVSVDLSQIPQSESSFMRTGEHVTVIGVTPRCATGPCDTGDRLTATSLIRSQ